MEPAPARPDSGAGHPGLLLRCHVLAALHLSVSQAARELGIARQTLHRILAGGAPITPETAVRLERLCGVSSGFWLDCQQRHALPRVRSEIAKDVTRIPSHPLPREILVHIGADDES
jgi:addiction module HigA family antidote